MGVPKRRQMVVAEATVWVLVDAPVGDELVDDLVELLGSESWDARHGAAAALGGASAAGRARAATAARGLLERDDWIEEVLADIGPRARRALPALLELVREEAAVVRAAARRVVTGYPIEQGQCRSRGA